MATSKPRRPVAKNFEAVAVRVRDGAEVSLGHYTTSRAALNAMAFRAAFGPAGVTYKVWDQKAGRFVQELTR
jgi:hypothetical protein